MCVLNESKQCQLHLQVIWIAKFIKINVCQVDVTNASQQQSCSIWFSAHQYYEISSQSNGKRRSFQYQFVACKMRQFLACKMRQ